MNCQWAWLKIGNEMESVKRFLATTKVCVCNRVPHAVDFRTKRYVGKIIEFLFTGYASGFAFLKHLVERCSVAHTVEQRR